MSERRHAWTKREAAPASTALTTASETSPAPANDNQVTAFSFGDPEPVLSRREVLEHIECWQNGRWWDPPVSLAGLSRALHAAPHHQSAIQVKLNLLTASFIPTRWVSRATFEGVALDYLVLANGYFSEVRNMARGVMRFDRGPAKYMRRGLQEGVYFFLAGGDGRGGMHNEIEFPAGAVHQLQAPSVDQELYGVPEYLSALQSAFLNENATLFRRRYYLNGSHAGFIMYLTGEKIPETDIDAIRAALKSSKGPGNFRNLFVHAPGGDKDGLKLIPVSEVAAKDEFLNIKGVTRDDILAAHRVPPMLLGLVPANAGGFGDPEKALSVFVRNEIEPLQSRFLALNDRVGFEAIRFRPTEVPTSTAA